MMKTINNSNVNAVLKTVVVTLLGPNQDGELIRNLVLDDKNLIDNFL
jgi:hypothetical protein